MMPGRVDNMRQQLFLACAIFVACDAASANTEKFKTGQYTLTGSQTICVKKNGTWYGTTYNFGGTWLNAVGPANAVLHGNYALKTDTYDGYGNTTLTIKKMREGVLSADWYDWFDDFTYKNFETVSLVFDKKSCDKRYRKVNNTAPSR